MKQKTKGILAFAFLGGILLTSTVMFALPPPDPTMTEEEVAMEEYELTKTGTLMDNFSEEERSTFCGTKSAQSNSFIKEFDIPTVCTQPLAIKVDPNGLVWFAESNSGNIGMFDPNSESFTEFENKDWPEGARSMIWGLDYSSDGSIWYTDPTFDSIWRFDTTLEEYNRLGYPSSESLTQGVSSYTGQESMPQMLQVIGSDIFVNDFTGGKITILDVAQGVGGEVVYTSIQSPLPQGFTGDFELDGDGNLWYTNWVPDSTGALVKFDLSRYTDKTQNSIDDDLYLQEFIEFYDFPTGLNTANGLSIDISGNVWIMDTSSSYFFKFDKLTEEFTKYTTPHPSQPSYGNYSGVIKSPISRPYWSSTSDNNLIFNEQTSNRIGIFDTQKESLIEYSIPSQNPGWGDCDFVANGELWTNNDCGIAQVFGFDVYGDKIWFSEWAENKIGVIDTSKSLPISVDVDTNLVSVKKGEKSNFSLTLTYSDSTWDEVEIVSSNTAPHQSFEYISTTIERNEIQNNQEIIQVTVYANEKSLPGEYKLLVGGQTDEVVISKFIDVVIES